MEDFLNQINQSIKDIFEHNINTTKAYVVPTRNDSALTFPIGADKQGKLIETCVLMIDIRNSTIISRKLKKDKERLGKIYSAFIYAMATIADEYGYVRNIIGDRLMVVFEPKDCFVNAINCAALMYTVAYKILAKHVSLGNDFKVGIGIEYGEMLVLKTGIRKKHEEQSEYKNLVWIGDAANIASKLCDFANKEYSSPLFNITYEEVSLAKELVEYKDETPPFPKPLFWKAKQIPVYLSQLVTTPKKIALNYNEFAKRVVVGTDGWKFENQKVVGFDLEQRTGTTSPILISGKVYLEYKKANSNPSFLNRFTSKDYPDKPNTGTGVFGGTLILPEITKIKT